VYRGVSHGGGAGVDVYMTWDLRSSGMIAARGGFLDILLCFEHWFSRNAYFFWSIMSCFDVL